MSLLRNLLIVVRHKWYFFLASRRVGIPFWRMIVHDLSLLFPSELGMCEFILYGPRIWSDDFHLAYMGHVHRNPHHWEHWVSVSARSRSGLYNQGRPLDMPEASVREMVADWLAIVRRLNSNWVIDSWVSEGLATMLVSQQTRALVQKVAEDINYGRQAN